MKRKLAIYLFPAVILVGIFLFFTRHSSYRVVAVEGGRVVLTDELDNRLDSAAQAVLAPYEAVVDSIMSPVIGSSACDMVAGRPESPLSNLVADILRRSTVNYIGRAADVAVTNMGGLRSSLPKGDITYGNIYEITPFENTLCILTMTGAQLKALFANIAAVRGEGLSGARLVITRDGQLVSATVDGKQIEDDKKYTVATLDYLAEGNDHLEAFKTVTDRMQPEGATVRQLFLNYVSELAKAGKQVTSQIEGRITIKE